MPVFKHSNATVNKLLEATNAKLEGEFTGVDDLFHYRCNIHNDVVQHAYYTNYRRGFTCRFCKEDKKIADTHASLSKNLESKGCILAFVDYDIKKYPYVNFVCKKHADMGLQKVYAIAFNGENSGCKYCAHDRHCVKMINRIRTEFASRGWQLLTTEYTHRRAVLEFICLKHPDKVLTTSWNAYMSGFSKSYGSCTECRKIALNKNNTKYIHQEDGRYTIKIKIKDINKRFGGYGTLREAIYARNKVCKELGILDRVLN